MSEKKQEEREEKLGNALLKVALGYQIAEVTEEYAEVNGELKLTKRKKTKKDVPPDLKAVQLLLSSEGGSEYGSWTEEELNAEKERLLSLLKTESEEGEESKKKGGRVATKTKKSASAAKKKTKTVTKKTVKEKV